MLRTYFLELVLSSLLTARHAFAQTATTSDYVGYNLTMEGDDDSVIYSTENTRPNASLNEPNPDVFLNASVHVGEIDLEVDNLTAKINLDAQVLNLLEFNAGVDLSIGEVRLLIENVTAKAVLEARLQNLVSMINTTLNSIDLNPIIATLGESVGEIADSATDAVGSTVSSAAGALEKRSYEVDNNVLYSVNDYSGNTHTNRVLAQNGDLIDVSLDNDGNSSGEKVIGTYESEMSFNGHEANVEYNGEDVTLKEYRYSPIYGIDAICAIYLRDDGSVAGTQVLAESNAGGSSTISEDIHPCSLLSKVEGIASRRNDIIRTTRTRINLTLRIAGTEDSSTEKVQITLALQDPSLGSAGAIRSGEAIVVVAAKRALEGSQQTAPALHENIYCTHHSIAPKTAAALAAEQTCPKHTRSLRKTASAMKPANQKSIVRHSAARIANFLRLYSAAVTRLWPNKP
ncbi:hypothetical protein KC356_g177 [Hortaea werneckii]|nr:hypothetical protein KC356_g177 [Hortaea werneckii]